MTMTKQRKILYRMIAVGFMAALVYVGNYMQIKIPNGILVTRIHLGNSMCLLAGLLFGGISGGLSSGIGAAMFDLFDPVYIVSAPYTFLSKFAMGFTAGALRRNIKGEKLNVIIAAIAGQLVYIVLYLLKSYLTVLIIGGTHEAAFAAAGLNLVTSLVNAGLAVTISVPLYFALMKALKSTPVHSLTVNNENSEEKVKKEKIFNPLTVTLTIFSLVIAILYSADLAAVNKIKAEEEKKEKALIERIEALEEKVDELLTKYVPPAA